MKQTAKHSELHLYEIVQQGKYFQAYLDRGNGGHFDLGVHKTKRAAMEKIVAFETPSNEYETRTSLLEKD